MFNTLPTAILPRPFVPLESEYKYHNDIDARHEAQEADIRLVRNRPDPIQEERSPIKPLQLQWQLSHWSGTAVVRLGAVSVPSAILPGRRRPCTRLLTVRLLSIGLLRLAVLRRGRCILPRLLRILSRWRRGRLTIGAARRRRYGITSKIVLLLRLRLGLRRATAGIFGKRVAR